MRRMTLLLAFTAWALPAAVATAADRGCVPPPYIAEDVPAVVAACSAELKSASGDADRARLLVLRGRAFKWVRQLENAAIDLEEAIKLAPNDPLVYVWRGWIAYDQSIYPYAAALAERGLSLKGDLVFAYDLLGSIAVQTGNLAAARDAYNKAIAIEPDNLHARDNRYRLYKRVGAQQEQLRELDEILALKSPVPDMTPDEVAHRVVSYRVRVRIERAELLRAMGRNEEAAKAYDEFVADDPGAVSFGFRATFHHLRGDDVRAMADVEAGLKADDGFAYLHATKGYILNTTKRYNEAVDAFTRALTLHPEDGGALWGRAVARRGLEQLKPSIADAQMALIVDGGFFRFKFKGLVERGYLPESVQESDQMAAVKDAAQACMIDKGCI